MQTRRVLVVDEDPLMRLAIDRQLDLLQWEAVSVNTGQEAVYVIELGLLVDVVLTELRLPDIDGRSVAWAISKILRRVRVAFMGYEVPSGPLEPRDAPFLLKPFSTPALANALSGAIPVRGWH
jgi:CheY-like chemotaxis protein